MAIVNKPNTFSGNTTISSSEINSNFDTLYNEFNGSISAANLADDAVTSAKLADNAVVTASIADASVTNAKLASQAWQSWTPTFGGWTIGTGGSAQTVAKYVQIGKTVFFKLNSTLGSSGASVSAPVKFTLPVTAASLSTTGSASMPIGLSWYEDNGSGNVMGNIVQTGTTEAYLLYYGASGTYTNSGGLNTSIPFAWGPGDSINCYGSYEAA